MGETLNKRIRPALAKEARENAKRYWERKRAAAFTNPRPCTCPVDEAPVLCQQKFALSECLAANPKESDRGV